MASTLNKLPDLGKAVIELADDVQEIMVALYEFQTTVSGKNSQYFVNVRKELKDQWEMLRAYLKRCRGFGADVVTLKEALGVESKVDMMEFLDDMKASADELQEISGNLKRSDMSTAFSKGNKSDEPEKELNRSSTNGIRNENLKAFIGTFVGANRPESVSEIDKALSRIKSNTNTLFKFWEDMSKECESLIKEVKASGIGVTTADVERIAFDWTYYQEAIERAILSITKTADAILVDGAPNLILAPVAAKGGHGSGKGAAGPRFGRGTFRWLGRLWWRNSN